MEKVVLPNGLPVFYWHRPGKSVVLQLMIKVGSNDEKPSERGISHFLEHILFEGTEKRPTNREITNEIEKIGGDFNAYTTNERTCFHIKVLRKHFPVAVEILSDILQHSLLKPADIARERNIVLKEIEMVNDEPRFYQWVLFQKSLFQKHPARYPTYGSRKVIRSLEREKVLKYFRKWYRPGNMALAVVGNVKSWQPLIRQKFPLPSGKADRRVPAPELRTRSLRVKERRKVVNTYSVLGFKTVPRTHPDAAVWEVINGILGRGQSGRMFSEIRVKRGLAYDVGTQHIAEGSFGYFAVYASVDRKKLPEVRKVIVEEIRRLREISPEDLAEAKTYIEGNYYLELEEPQKLADQILFWEQAGGAPLMEKFIPSIQKVTTADVRRVVGHYAKNFTHAVIEGK